LIVGRLSCDALGLTLRRQAIPRVSERRGIEIVRLGH
jgi:hypothetical protein